MASKAPADGHYTTTDDAGRTHQFKVRKGDVYPPDAEFVAADQAAADTAAKPNAKEQQAKRGPSETTAKANVSESA